MSPREKLALFGGQPTLKKPLAAYNSIGSEEERAALRVMRAARKRGEALSGFLGRGGEGFLGGAEVKKLEENFRKRFKVKYAISFNSATTALQATVAALGIGPGDQVITTPFTMSATATAILLNGAVPVFADIDEQTFCLGVKLIEGKINAQTKAIIVTNLFGGTADYDPILHFAKKRGIKIIEDNAQAAGAFYKERLAGTIGDAGVFSFNVHKVIQSGEGGMMVTNNKRYAYRAQLARNHGEAVEADAIRLNPKYVPELVLGSNYRLTEIQAAIVTEQLKKLDKLNTKRIALADHLSKRLKDFNWLAPAYVLPRSRHVYYLYPLRFFSERAGISRATFATALAAEGFPLSEGYNTPLHFLPIYQHKRIFERTQFPFVSSEFPQDVSYEIGSLPVAERMFGAELLMTTLCQPPKSRRDVDLFVKAIQKIETNLSLLKEYERERKV